MRAIGLRLVLESVVFVAVLGGLACAGESSKGASSRASIESKADYCQTCHGLGAQGFRGYFTMPRLAGQQPQYIENQLHAFMQHRRLNPIMQNVVTGLTPGMVQPLANYLSSLNPPPYGGAPADNVSMGKNIFEAGLPEANIPACAVCHGPGAKGHGQIPRLAGQLYWYVTKTLTNFNRERGQGGQDSSAIMAPIARNLSPAQVSAIAAYVSTLR